MPTIPVTFNYYFLTGSGFPGYGDNDWLIEMGYWDADGAFQTLTRRRSDNASLSPLSFDVDMDAAFPIGTDDTTLFGGEIAGSAQDRSYFAVELTYPDEWGEILYLRMGVHGFLLNAVPGSHGFSSADMSTLLVQPARESGELPGVVPLPVYFATQNTGGGAEHLEIRNYSLDDFPVSISLEATWGDGTESATEADYTLPAASLSYSTYSQPGGTTWFSWLKRIPRLVVKTNETVTEPDWKVLYDTPTNYLAELRIPVLGHSYDSVGHTIPTVRAVTSAGNTTPWKGDPWPVANFEQIDTNLNGLHLDAAKSFDITNTIGLYFWYFRPYHGESVAPAKPPVAPIVKTEPIIRRIDMAPGKYWAYLAVGNGSLEGFEYTFDTSNGNANPLSVVRAHIVTVKAGRHDSFVSPQRELFAAVNYDEDVRVFHFPNGSASRHTLHIQHDAQNPSLYRGQGNALVLGFTDTATGNYQEIQSNDSGVTWDG